MIFNQKRGTTSQGELKKTDKQLELIDKRLSM